MQPAQCNTEVYLQNSLFHGFLLNGSETKQFSIIYWIIKLFQKSIWGLQTENFSLFNMWMVLTFW